MTLRSAVLLSLIATHQAQAIDPADPKAPLPAPVRTAKTVALVNSTPDLATFDKIYARVLKIKGWTITEDKEQADLVLVFRMGEPQKRGVYVAPIGNAGIAVPIVVQYCFLDFLDKNAKLVLSTNARREGAGGTAKALLAEVEQRLAEHPKR